MIVRYELDGGGDTFATVPARLAERIGDVTEMARGLLVAIPGAARIQIWSDGRSFSDEPDADARAPLADPPIPGNLVLDVATAVIVLADIGHTIPTGPPAWLRRERGGTAPAPEVPQGRATRGPLPPV
ncbi:hypothetical protein I6A60_13525 [Frankia sp. AgB1.9]|uniref:hypothetical protein n=1 Tax=unclassified Frankia TaxID=2632575 RepID=UPI0019348674|nr:MULTISPECIES: hypothetical protein [unclassified Frankia]MBL7494152.1 hypothetical protein [Frankia sp. AgW1.1]MBL7548891.1 hypothetical protein [Frankia sp. AgB1.9]MBL7625196.1 hypothetical protein [Frankia sp. AgB1.8]